MVETKINNLQLCMQKLETTLDFLKENQKENTELNRAEHREMLDKMDAWMDNANKSFAKKWVEDDILNINKKIERINSKNENRNFNWIVFLVNILILIILAVIGIKLK